MVDYTALLRTAPHDTYYGLAAFLVHELPYVWLDDYRAVTPRDVDVDCIDVKGFTYVFDSYSILVRMGKAPPSPVEDRLVGVIGRSAPPKHPREATRLRGWVGPTERSFGKDRDKGHFIAHTTGGSVDGTELNVFLQRRDFNRGWSAAGKRYRTMEKYCARTPGTLCFSRPLYEDETSTPAIIEFGILLPELRLWVERFDNRLADRDSTETVTPL